MKSIHDLDREVIVEMSMVDIVYTLLKNGPKEPRSFQDLLHEAAALKNLSEEMKLEIMARLYTDINIDGRFKSVGDNYWGLRSWYAVEQNEEIVITDLKKRSKKKKRILDSDFEDYDEDDLLDLEDEELDVYDELLDDEEEDEDEEEEEEEEDFEELEGLEELEDIDDLDDPDFEAEDDLETELDEEDDVEDRD